MLLDGRPCALVNVFRLDGSLYLRRPLLLHGDDAQRVNHAEQPQDVHIVEVARQAVGIPVVQDGIEQHLIAAYQVNKAPPSLRVG